MVVSGLEKRYALWFVAMINFDLTIIVTANDQKLIKYVSKHKIHAQAFKQHARRNK